MLATLVSARKRNQLCYRSFVPAGKPPIKLTMNCSAQACMDVCDFACGFDECPGETGTVDDDANYFAREKGMNALKAVHITTALLSVLGSLFVLVTYHLIPTHKGASLRIVYWLSVSDLVSSFVYIVDGGSTANEEGSARCPNGACVLLASLSQVFNLSAIVWNTYIALNMYG